MDAPEPYTMNPPKSWPLLQVEVEVCEWVKSNETEANETDVKEGEESEKKEGELTSLHAALTLHPIPCTLHPTPPAPCTPHPTPYNPHSATCETEANETDVTEGDESEKKEVEQRAPLGDLCPIFADIQSVLS
jgi:hypothetical protein